jgi:type IV pilus assembly protein PilF
MMVINTKNGVIFCRSLVLWLMVLLAVPGIVGCAGSMPAHEMSDQEGDIKTDSDESVVRKRARIRLELAVAYFQQGKTTIALDELKQALAVDPNFSDAHNLRGLIYMRLNEYTVAKESFYKALELRPGDANVLHNLGWLACQQASYAQAFKFFSQALANPQYADRAKTWMTQGLCQVRSGALKAAEASLLKAYEYDAANPVTGYNLAHVLFLKKDNVRAQFYIRRLNNSEWANAESLWLGIKIERRMANTEAMLQLAAQLEKRFSQSPQTAAYRRGAWNE